MTARGIAWAAIAALLGAAGLPAIAQESVVWQAGPRSAAVILPPSLAPDDPGARALVRAIKDSLIGSEFDDAKAGRLLSDLPRLRGMLGDDADLTLAEATAKHQLRQFAAAAADYRAGLARADGGSSLRQLAVGNYERAQRDQEIQLYGFAFRDCAECPIMVRIPAGQFTMGSPAGEQGRESVESPQRVVNIRSFALGKTEVTFAEWDACVNAGGCSHRPHDQGWGRGTRPVMNVSWDDAKQYATWLSRRTGKQYRLPSEAEWEYAARAGTTTRFSCGDSDGCLSAVAWYYANSNTRTQPVGAKQANGFGLHDMHGNVWEWVEDCWNASYSGAPVDGSAWTYGDCQRRVVRGGSWVDFPGDSRSAYRNRNGTVIRIGSYGFRVARTN